MKQIVQNLRSGTVEVVEVPTPRVFAGHVLIQTRASLISSGSERTVVEFGRASLLAKARSEPERVRQVLDKIHSDGLLPTLEAVFARLDEPLPLGYCNAGVVLEVGDGVEGLRVGDRVASNGSHAEVVCVPRNLCVRIPESVDDEQASFTVLGAVALEGIRLLAPTLGESVAVVGLGLVGMVAVQLLRASGCRVLGFDPHPARRKTALALGAEVVSGGDASDPRSVARVFSAGRGMDGVLITASAKDSDLIRQAAGMSRKRGRIVLTGVVGMELDRREFYDKELTFQVSCSYGPGRYDPRYEERGEDYPLPYVRWTAQRNFEAFLDLLKDQRIGTAPLIGRRALLAEAPKVYEALATGGGEGAPGIVLTYPAAAMVPREVRITLPAAGQARGAGGVRAGVIGAGQFAKAILMPALRASGVRMVSIASQRGLAARHLGRKFGFRSASSDPMSVIHDPEVDTVFIVTRHDSHASLAAAALRAGKHTFVEKPLALTLPGLEEVLAAHRAAGDRHLMVGFNRRFAPLVQRMMAPLRERSGPASLVATVNAGALPERHWLLDPAEGGGRIIGEGCHWVDLMVLLAGVPVERVLAVPVGMRGPRQADPGTTLILDFADGSVGTLHYLTSGHRRFPKERVDVFFDGKVLSLQNFAVLEGFGIPGLRRVGLWRQDKGHRAEISQFVERVARGGEPLIPLSGLEHVTRIGFCAAESARTGHPVTVDAAGGRAGESGKLG